MKDSLPPLVLPPPPPPTIPVPKPTTLTKNLTLPQITKPAQNVVNIPGLGKVDFTSTNREFSLEASETDIILKKHLLPKHATDPNILRFIDNYLHCRDAKEAAMMTGLNRRDGHNLLNRKDIYETIQKITATSVRKFGYDAEEIVEKVKEVAFIDPALIQNPDGSFINNMTKMPPEVRRAIKKMKVKNLFETDANEMPVLVGEIIEIEFWDKMKAIEMLGREKDTFKTTAVVQHEVGKSMRDVLLASGKRAEKRMEAIEAPPPIDITPNKGE